MASQALLLKPFHWLVRDRFDTLAIAPRVTMPVLIVHGTDDEVIPFWMGEVLAKAFPDARFLAIENAHHNDLWEEDADEVTSAIASFVASPR
jgi:pimeloyl-ACP methyl ester carboxylesterase